VLTIGQVAARAGLSASAIRYYEQQGLLPPPIRSGGRRVYDRTILDRLAVIELAKHAGFELKEIRTLLSRAAMRKPNAMWAALAERKRRAVDDEIARLTTMKVVLAEVQSCACATLADCGRMFDAARGRLPSPTRTTRRERAQGVSRRASGRRTRVTDKA
jgi:MerR family redox-sensitive transcriptional activator SoxR